jgi:hypothetical protein
VYSAGRPRELFLHVGFHGFTALQQEQDGLISDAFMKHSVNALVDDPAPLHASMGASKGESLMQWQWPEEDHPVIIPGQDRWIVNKFCGH